MINIVWQWRSARFWTSNRATKIWEKNIFFSKSLYCPIYENKTLRNNVITVTVVVAVLTCDPRNLWPWSGVVVPGTFTRPSRAACVAREILGDGDTFGDTLGDGDEYLRYDNDTQGGRRATEQRSGGTAAKRTPAATAGSGAHTWPSTLHSAMKLSSLDPPPPSGTVGRQFSFSRPVFPVSPFVAFIAHAQTHVPWVILIYQSNRDRYRRGWLQKFVTTIVTAFRLERTNWTHRKAGSRRAQESPSPCRLDRIGFFRRRTPITGSKTDRHREMRSQTKARPVASESPAIVQSLRDITTCVRSSLLLFKTIVVFA